MKTRYPLILLLNTAGLALFLSWYISAGHGLWPSLDTGVFRFFSHKLTESPLFLWIVVITNNRAFGGCSSLAIDALMLHFRLKEMPEGRRRIVATGLAILLTAVVLNQLGQALTPVKRASPTLMLDNIYRVSKLLYIPTKGMSKDSFPGDHSMMPLVSPTFMLHYFGEVAGIIGLTIAVVFALPCVMISIHWLTGIVVGSVTMVLVGLPWWLITPLNDRLVTLFVDYLSDKNERFLNR